MLSSLVFLSTATFFGAAEAPAFQITEDKDRIRIVGSALEASIRKTGYVTGVEAQIRQRFLHRYYFVLAAGYQNVDYEYFASGTSVAAVGSRRDEIFYIHPSVGIDVTPWLTCELGAEFRSDSSTVVKSDFSEATVYFQFNVFF